NVFYFVSLIILMLYLNLVVISRRHWSRGQQITLAGQFAARIAALILILLAWNYTFHAFSSASWARMDFTADRVYSLDAVTVETLRQARDNERPVTIQAYISRDVPRHYVSTQKQLAGLLRQFSSMGGAAVNVRVIDVTPNSPEELEAQNIGIDPLIDRTEIGGKLVEQKIYLGAHLSSPLGDVTLPVIGNDAAIEYELSRAVALVTDREFEISLGIVDTDTFFAGPEIDGVRIPWIYDDTMKSLKKLFKIEHIRQESLGEYLPKPSINPDTGEATPAAPTRKPPRVLLVADPSSLSQTATQSLVEYIRAGHPVILLADPMPAFFAFQDPTEMGVMNAPRQPRISPDNPFVSYLASSPAPKADAGSCRTLMQSIGVHWDNGEKAYHLSNPHSGFVGNWPTYLGNVWPRFFGPFESAFVFCKSSGSDSNMNATHPITAGLKDLLFFHTGHFIPLDDAQGFEFTPLVTLGESARLIPWEELTFVPTQTRERVNPTTRRREFSQTPILNRYTRDELTMLNPNPRSRDANRTVCISAHVAGVGDNKANVVLIGDLDFLSYWTSIQQDALNKPLDNINLLVNAIEVLAGNRSYVALRNRRVSPRTLVTVEREIERYRADRSAEQRKLEEKLREELENARDRFKQAADKLSEDESMNTIQMRQALFQEAYDSQAQFERQKEKLEKDLQREIDRLKSAEQRQISKYESFVRNLAVGLAPLPALILGVVVLSWRRINENRLIRPERKAR
ncbi:MAG TPA: GldG family protein, partial [Pirellulaceae bacterium]|nr:GldG family protein [Pirellulaceae bacterium]